MAKHNDRSNLNELKKRTAQRTEKASLEQNLRVLEQLLPGSPTCESDSISNPVLLTDVIDKHKTAWEAGRSNGQIITDLQQAVSTMYELGTNPKLIAEQLEHRNYTVQTITTAYEQGFGYGIQNRTHYKNPYGEDNSCAYAWNIGLQEGIRRFTNKQFSDIALNEQMLSFVKQVASLGDKGITQEQSHVFLDGLMKSACSLLNLHGVTDETNPYSVKNT